MQVPDPSLFTYTAGTFSKTTTLNFKLISFLPTGNYVGEKVFELTDVLKCGLPSTKVELNVGNNIETVCTFNFDYLA